MSRGSCVRSWTANLSILFPVAALVAALTVFATAGDITPRLVGLVGLSLVPWALLAGGVRMPDAAMTLGVAVPAVTMVLWCGVSGAMFGLILLVMWQVSRAAPWGLPLVASVAGTGAVFVMERTNPDHDFKQSWILFGAGLAFSWFGGSLLRRERMLVGQLEQAQALLTDAAAAEERRRIAREIHDIVGHSLTVVLLNVAGARRLVRTDPDAAADALAQAEALGRDSLDHVREAVGLLRAADDEAGASAPLPGGDDLATLVDRFRAAGNDVQLRVDGDPATLEPGAGLAVYRVVQEALTNAGRHAPGAPVDVRVTVGERVHVRVRNGRPARSPAPSGPPGAGLVGMRERLAAAGGVVDAAPTGDGGWLVTAELSTRAGAGAGDRR